MKPKSFVSNLIVKPFKSFLGKGEQQEEDLEKIAAREHKPFAYKTLVSATKDFHLDNKLGEGGFGPVYKGKLEDGKVIAVKKLSLSSKQGNKEFTNEARLLARVQHRNVVNLLGYCVHGTDKLLVYEYLPRQSLDKFLFHADSKKREELDWKKRYDIIVGVARGVLYLHEDSHVSIIHRDIKASNILLGEKWIPKIADFGMARLYPEEQTHINTRVAGTNGYMAPEYVMHGHLSVKADVYSFGVLVLELICGQKNSTFNMDKVAKNLLEWAWKLYKNERSMDMVDATIASEEATEQIASCIKIGLLCVQADPKLRPTMRKVVLMLLKKSNVVEEPTVPGYPGHRYRKTRRHAGSSSSIETAESSQIHTASTSGTFSSGESSQNLDSTFNSGMSSTSTPTRPGERYHEKHGTSLTHTMRTRPSRYQRKDVTSSTSSVTDPMADRAAGKRPVID